MTGAAPAFSQSFSFSLLLVALTGLAASPAAADPIALTGIRSGIALTGVCPGVALASVRADAALSVLFFFFMLVLCLALSAAGPSPLLPSPLPAASAEGGPCQAGRMTDERPTISRLAPTRVPVLRNTVATLAIGRVAILPRFFSTALMVMAPVSRHSPRQPMLVRVLLAAC